MKLERLLAITMLLLQKKRLTAKQLAERFEVSLRTVYRDLSSLNLAGIPIVSYPGADGGYEIVESFRLERQYLTLEELQSIVSVVQGFQSIFDDRRIGVLLDKVQALIGKGGPEEGTAHRELIIDLNPWGNSAENRERANGIRRAIQNQCVIRLVYKDWAGNVTERSVEPLVIVMREYAWYLYAYCRLKKGRRIFRLSRIQSWEPLAETFVRRDMQVQVNDWIEEWRNDSAEVLFLLRFHPRRANQVEEAFGSDHIVRGDDGFIYVRTEFPLREWVYAMFLSFGPDLKVMEPEEAATVMREMISRMHKLYADNPSCERGTDEFHKNADNMLST